ncbi:MAG: hypothetical protein ACRECH_04450 [Nitrososphaerales archaeon]
MCGGPAYDRLGSQQDKSQLVVYSKSEVSAPGAPHNYPANLLNDNYVYGYGGETDKLTEVTDSIEYTYNYYFVNINQNLEQCWWHSSTYWVIDSCLATGYQGSGNGGNPAYAYNQGSFHWNCCFGGTGYYHTLYDKTYAYSDGTFSCFWVYPGMARRSI